MFMELMNKVYKPYLDMFVILFIDDRLIYLRNEEDMFVIFFITTILWV